MGGFFGFLWFVLHFAGYFIVISISFLMSCPNCIVLSDSKEGKEKIF